MKYLVLNIMYYFCAKVGVGSYLLHSDLSRKDELFFFSLYIRLQSKNYILILFRFKKLIKMQHLLFHRIWKKNRRGKKLLSVAITNMCLCMYIAIACISFFKEKVGRQPHQIEHQTNSTNTTKLKTNSISENCT